MDEHPLSNIQKGAFDIKQEINAFIASRYWNNSVFILAYDEGGGMYARPSPKGQSCNACGTIASLFPKRRPPSLWCSLLVC